MGSTTAPAIDEPPASVSVAVAVSLGARLSAGFDEPPLLHAASTAPHRTATAQTRGARNPRTSRCIAKEFAMSGARHPFTCARAAQDDARMRSYRSAQRSEQNQTS